jgi:hypothetical protein
LCYLVADPDLDVFAHYDKANQQVEVQLTALLGARQTAKTKLLLSHLPRIIEIGPRRISFESWRHETALHREIAEPPDVSLSAPPVLLI